MLHCWADFFAWIHRVVFIMSKRCLISLSCDSESLTIRTAVHINWISYKSLTIASRRKLVEVCWPRTETAAIKRQSLLINCVCVPQLGDLYVDNVFEISFYILNLIINLWPQSFCYRLIIRKCAYCVVGGNWPMN